MLPAREMATPSGGDMQNAFESWIGQPVVVQLALGQAKVSLRGVLLRDLTETLLMKPEAGPSIEIAKTKILAIEQEESKKIFRLLARRDLSPSHWHVVISLLLF